jgi:hypothetical protein
LLFALLLLTATNASPEESIADHLNAVAAVEENYAHGDDAPMMLKRPQSFSRNGLHQI